MWSQALGRLALALVCQAGVVEGLVAALEQAYTVVAQLTLEATTPTTTQMCGHPQRLETRRQQGQSASPRSHRCRHGLEGPLAAEEEVAVEMEVVVVEVEAHNGTQGTVL